MFLAPSPPRRALRGLSLVGLLGWVMALCIVVLGLVRVVPALLEYQTILSAVKRVATQGHASVAEVRAAFDKQAQIDFTEVRVRGQDLDIHKEDERVVVAFAYEREVPLAGPVFLLFKFRGSSAP